MTLFLNTNASLAIDTQSLAKLRLAAKRSPDHALKAVAQQFESVFMNMMLKSMRAATPQNGMMDSDQSRLFTSMLDQQLAQSMSSRGIGLADMMVKQLGHKASSALLPSVLSPPSTLLPTQSVPSAFNAHVQQDFVNQMLPHAMQASQATGVPPQLMLGQAALESGWGRREIKLQDGRNSFNLFGIKANSSWQGKVAEVMTTEYKDGIASKQVAKFRAYPSYAAAFKDYARMMSSNPRYDTVLKQGDAVAMAQAVQASGYATDPKYGEKLARVMKQINI
ncbi:MAG: flagellar assembly peptidoglycan hydrolase FlgJ [Gallionella sp.]